MASQSTSERTGGHNFADHLTTGAVREVKKLLAKTSTYKDFQQALRNYRNCPRYDGLSPAQWYFGRRQRTEAVAFPSAYSRIPENIMANHEYQRKRNTDKKKGL